jgi:small-conductance mechanosensitive channel
MKHFKNLPAWVLAALLVFCVVASYLTRDTDATRAAAKKLPSGSTTSLIDQRMLQTAQQMAADADTPQEQAFAQEALRLSDHELDQAFASALREASATSAPASGPLKELGERITGLKSGINADQLRIAKLTKEAAANSASADRLELAKAQMALDEDELEDAQQDLARQGGDQHADLERALADHEAMQKQAASVPKAPPAAPTARLSQQTQAWFLLGDRQRQLDAARQQAENKAATLEREHDALEKLAGNKPAPAAATGAAATPASDSSSIDADSYEEEDTATMVARLRRLSDRKKTLTELDKRIQDSRQLADIYKRWDAAAEARRRGVMHLLLRSLAAVLAILLAVVLIDGAIRRAFDRQSERKRLHQLRVISTIAVQLIGASLIVLIIFGPPNQISTIIGLTTAGLTVALKDFIVAFFGWFALMGRNGIRVGDWVEINGVSGEVIEIGLLKTALLEMGNWATTGHPTGRRVAFVNSFAIEGHYFNFSTAGQWLWDELQVNLPVAGDPYEMAQQIRQMVEEQTKTEGTAAEQDWERVTRQYGIRPFSAKPAVDLRPSPTGLTVVVRYITRAPQRYEVKSRLFDAIVDLFHKPAASPAKLS